MSNAPENSASCVIDSPFGRLHIAASGGAVTRLSFCDAPVTPKTDHPLLAQAVQQLEEYFAGARREFDLPLDPPGGAFQKSVCGAILEIPFGETRTYGDLARGLNAMPQPVGQGCGGNPIAIIIPCHRVMAADGKLGGFSGGEGAETKLALLRHEGALLL